jgi:thymidylate kinase
MQYRNILLEGTDRAGKTTLAQRIGDELGFDSIKLRHQEADQYARYVGYYVHADNAVFDRGHISEDLYGPLYGRLPSFTPRQLTKLDKLVNETCLVIFCLPKPTLALKRLATQQKAGEDVITSEDLLRSCQAFEQALKRFPNHLIFRSSNKHKEMDELIAHLKQRFGPKPPLYLK